MRLERSAYSLVTAEKGFFGQPHFGLSMLQDITVDFIGKGPEHLAEKSAQSQTASHFLQCPFISCWKHTCSSEGHGPLKGLHENFIMPAYFVCLPLQQHHHNSNSASTAATISTSQIWRSNDQSDRILALEQARENCWHLNSQSLLAIRGSMSQCATKGPHPW